jgi:hypothetical protein
MAPSTLSPRLSHPFDSCPYSPAISASNLQAVKAESVARAFGHINASRSWGTKHYTRLKSCAIDVVPLPKPKAAYLPSKPLVLRPQLSGHLKCALKTFSSAHKHNLFVRASVEGPPASDEARQERAKAHAGIEKRLKGISGLKIEPAPGVENAANPDKQRRATSVHIPSQ